MIQSLLNLACASGHRYFSPTPELWIGKECLHGAGGRVCKADLVLSSTPELFVRQIPKYAEATFAFSATCL
jgi:hypothetical protein